MDMKFSSRTLPFLTEAGQQTDPNWLEQNQATYEAHVRGPFIDLAERLKAALQPSVPDYHFPIKGIGRIKRATHHVVSGGPCFKDWLSISISKPSYSRFERNPHLFFGILPNIPQYMGVVVAGGLFMPSGPQLRKVRSAIAQDARLFHALFDDPTFKARFKTNFSREEVASRPPRGFDPDHPDMDWLRLKKFLVVKKLTNAEFTSRDLVPAVVEDFKQLVRLNRFLENALT
ncbi:TIGR02453 family protein [Malikia spinosa]|jgi:uncharacterized protein (TIGR02453 family)|uniref:TIGR02453 family protein n=2 Tax=Malikia spinosa TaxID=86180 RepID=A0A2S9KF10_9BURK|nr:TIGR02453 family protein [Malikia spinosa]MYZ52240.1 TIGR02453 family protein [Malikia spinosa]OGB72825.1 MAG: hypothetical protein A2486_07385 [Burkholderiales bacterium RIFOXYC12_FULL_65_23]PRD69029.1 hypothetical protein C6P61_08080 [Malikia spinosa]